MKPAFALSLSFDGIALLHRAAGGWRFVGEVSLESDDLAGDLAKLREKALRLVPGDMRCKVIIPNDQVRYLSVTTGSFTGEARDRIVATTLDEATPYALADLAFDTSPDGEVTHIAAVARETLNEAEAFAEEHGFGPVSFVAIPGDNDFLGEPFFGKASALSRKERVEPDGVAVVVIGPALVPAETAAATGEAPSFSSRRARHPAPSYDIDPDAEVHAPRINFSASSDDTALQALSDEVVAEDDAPPAAEPEVVEEEARPIETDPPRPAKTDGSVASDSPPLTTFVDLPDGAAADVTAPVLSIPDEADEVPAEGFAAFLSRRSRPPRSEVPSPRRHAAEPAPALTAQRKIEMPLPQRQVPKDEAGRMTVFGARNNDPISGQGRRLGLILTGGLLVVLMVVAIWASLFLEDGLAGLFRSGNARTEIAVRPAAVPAPSVQTDDPVMAAAPPETTRVTAPEPVVLDREPQGPELSATDAAVLDALRDSNQPEEAEVPDQPPDPDMVPATDEPAETETAMLSEPVPQVDEEALADGQEIEEAEPAPVTEMAAEQQPSPPMTDAARYAATGIWPVAPNVPETPSIIGIDDLYIASIDRTDLSQDAIALMPLDALDTDRVPGGQQSPAAAGTDFALNSAGLVEPSAAGTLNPDGVLVFQGPPPRRPPTPPVRAEVAPQVQQAEQSRLASVRPRLRPADLPERVERSSLGGLTRAELATVRPKLRPASLVVPESAPAAAENPAQESAVPASASASALAVSTSPRPDARPAGFASLVARAKPAPSVQDHADDGDGEPETVAAATVAPRIPTSASVARQATLKNAINLRQLNLIGVYGTPSNRRALIRLPSGRYKKVQVGDTVDGGRVVAIGDGELRYQKGGRNMTLKVPSG